MEGLDSSYTCLLIHFCWKVDREAGMEPPIHTEYLRSGGAMILTFSVLGARAVISFCTLSAMPGYMVVPPDSTGGAGGHGGHLLLKVQGKVSELLLDVMDDFLLCRGGEAVAMLREDLHEESFWPMLTITPWCWGHPMMEGKTAQGASSPAKLALHMLEPVVDHERGNIIIHGELVAVSTCGEGDVTGKVIATQYFDMYEGEHRVESRTTSRVTASADGEGPKSMYIDPADNSGPMTNFIQSAPSKSLLFMVTHDDGSSRLKEDAKKAIEALGSKEIRNMRFRSSWINHSDDAKNRYSGWPAEIQVEGCIPKGPS
ncbi:hypothetical protein Celaphus_00012898 [Cervus elaphus hippelaphus]|uniref:ILEI/PANDER domain-containing protein n=1 Tax=Cervus elaphus hippelaphus TaxID=46360 RepID=A0A212CIQ4_CEREH|nr:hypothetical protein Celaphus_00012898 [Cervus elaphus hippelaphus]